MKIIDTRELTINRNWIINNKILYGDYICIFYTFLYLYE